MQLGYPVKTIPAKAAVKDIDENKGIIYGYFSVFGNEDGDGDTIVQGAFTKTISERGPGSANPRIKVLRNHLIYEPVAKPLKLQEDTKGLYYEAKPGTHAIGRDTVEMIKSEIITEHSIGYEIVRKEIINADADWYLQKRRLLELILWEGSLLTAWGANELTGSANLKSMGKEAYVKMLSDRQANVEKFCRKTTATDQTIELLLLESKQLMQIILDLSQEQPTTPVPHKSATLPGTELLQVLSNFKIN